MVKRAFKIVSGIIGFTGFMLMLGTAGASDYATEIGEYYPLSNIIYRSAIGLAMMIYGMFAQGVANDQ